MESWSVNDVRSELEYARFLIDEPIRGLLGFLATYPASRRLATRLKVCRTSSPCKSIR